MPLVETASGDIHLEDMQAGDSRCPLQCLTQQAATDAPLPVVRVHEKVVQMAAYECDNGARSA